VSDELRQSVVSAPDQAKRRAGRMLELEFGKTWDFDDPAHEWRRLFSELLGTFLLVLVGAGGGVVNAQSNGAIGRAAAVTAPGLMVMAIILFMGAVSGAHLNPAVSIAFAARGDFPWRRVPGYIIVQLLGATLACLVLWALLGKIGMLGATEPGPGISATQAMFMELLLTMGLVSTILGTASGAQNVGVFGAIGVGGYIILAGLWSSPISGASMNPARSFGPDLVLVNSTNYWAYVVGPRAGALIAVGFAWVLRGAGGGRSGAAAAQGRIGRLETSSEQAVEEARRDETA
jgi:aquaporin Z